MAPPDNPPPPPAPAPAPKRPRRDFSRDECLRAWHAYFLLTGDGGNPTVKWLALNARIPAATVHRRCVKLGLPFARPCPRRAGALTVPAMRSRGANGPPP